jgi:hypothetical protein
MAQQGGPRTQRTNTQAKPVSGPGALSQRTDMVNSDPNVYGDRKETKEIMSGAPMAKAQPVPTPRPVVGLFDPTQNPNEPVTAGAGMGAGPGMDALGPSPDQTFNKQLQADNQRLVQYLPSLEQMANDPSASNTFRNFIQYLKSIA